MTYEPSAELSDLLGALLDDEITVDESDRLAEVLSVDVDARAFYRELIETHSMMVWQRRAVALPFGGSYDDARAVVPDLAPVLGVPEWSGLGIQTSDFSIHTTPLSTLHSPFSTYLTSGWPVAYLIATVIFGVGLAVGAFTYVSHPGNSVVSGQWPVVSASNPQSPIPNPLPKASVARITGMVDCVWEEANLPSPSGKGAGGEGRVRRLQSLIPNPQSLVSIGDRLALRSGLLEITYDTGAKVILQGPVTYEVESPTGGYLSLGKLTAKLEKNNLPSPSGRGAGGEGGGSSPLSTLPSPLFAVRTPTATITDLGTEFGVEVLESGAMATHVFRGVVEVQMATDGIIQATQTVRLGENESLRVDKQPDGKKLVSHRDAADASAFIRGEQLLKVREERRLKPLRRWQTYSQGLRKDSALIAYYTFEDAKGNSAVLPNLSAAGKALNGQIDGAEWVYGRLPGKFALYFRGPGSGDKVVLPNQDRFNFSGPFSIAVWFRGPQFTAVHQALVTKGDSTWRIQRGDPTTGLLFATNSLQGQGDYDREIHKAEGDTKVDDSRWHLVVATCEPIGSEATLRLYLDGRLDAESKTPLPLRRNAKPVWLGANSDYPGLEFGGWIDEVAILIRPLFAKEVEAMYNAGNPAGSIRPERLHAPHFQPK